MQGSGKGYTFSVVRQDNNLNKQNESNTINKIQSESVSKLRASASVQVQEQQEPRVLVATTTTDTGSPVHKLETETSSNLGYWHWSQATEPYKVDALKLACKVSNCDLNFIRKITGENGSLAHDKQSGVPRTGKGSLNGKEDSWGYCQMYRVYQAKYLDDSRFWNDKEWQMNVCYEKYKGGTPMYANYRPKNEFTFIKY